MTNAFRKKKCVSQFQDHGSRHIADIEVFTSKEVETCGSVSTVVERKVKNIHDYAKQLGLPTSEEYKLEAMLRAGHVPEAVPVSGMLDNPDPTSLDNQFDLSAGFAQLQDMEPAPAAEPAKTD